MKASRLVTVLEDLIPGGLADGKADSEFDAEQLEAGIKVELEHTDDKEKAKEIAKDHLSEDPEYYKKLASIENKDEDDSKVGNEISPEQNTENKVLKLSKKYEKGSTSYMYWPCTINLCDRRLHVTAKFFGDIPLTVEEVRNALLHIEDIDAPINVSEIEWEPVVFATKNDGAVAVLELKKYPRIFDQIHYALEKFRRDDYASYKPHITVSQEDWERVEQEKLTPDQADLQFMPLELSIKGVTRYKWGPEGGYVEEIEGKSVKTINPTAESLAVKVVKGISSIR